MAENGLSPSRIIAPDMGLVVPVRAATFGTELPQGQDVELKPWELAFSGAWCPDEDPLKIGKDHFADLQNYRYSNQGLEGVSGYTALTTVALTKTYPRNGIHFVKLVGATTYSSVLVQSTLSGPDTTNGAVSVYSVAIPGSGEFDASALWTDSAGAGLGRFALGPDGTLLYCNGVESLIWGSPYHRAGAILNTDAAAATFSYDITEPLQRGTNVAGDLPTLVPDGAGVITLEILTTRPIQGITFDVAVSNTSAATCAVAYWNGSGHTAVSGLVDGTDVAGVSLGQSGTVSFTSTVGSARFRVQEGRLLYSYRAQWSGTPAATIRLFGLTVDTPMQPLTDVWDGVERQPIGFFVDSTQDYTLDVLEESSGAAPIGADLSALASGHYCLVAFEERMTALQVKMVPRYGNGAAATLTLSYWNGTAYVSTGATDGTSSGGDSMTQSGSLIWHAVGAQEEFPQTAFGRTGFWYKLEWNADLSPRDSDDNPTVLLDTITGIPAPRWDQTLPPPPATFPFSFAGRAMLAGLRGSQRHAIEYCAPGRPDVWNGEESSDRGKAIYIGDAQPLTAAREMSNRYLSQLKQLAAVTKATQTWILEGTGPDSFSAFLVSDAVGCPAPLSMCSAEIPSSAEGQTLRNVLIWCSHKGPVLFDGSVLLPMRFPQPDGAMSSVECYFNPSDSRYVKTSMWERVVGWYDSQSSEYNLLLPSGSSANECNTWLVCDLRRRKWYRKVPSVYPQLGLPVRDTTGTAYAYGGLDTGILYRLEYGNTWGGSAIAHVLDTADVPYGGSVFAQTRARFVRCAAVTDAGSGTVTIAHAIDGSGSFTTQTTLTLAGSGRFQVATQSINRLAFSHQWRLSSSTSDAARAPRLLGMGVVWHLERVLEHA